MAFNGTLFTAGSYQVTGEKYIDYGKYNATMNVQDLDSYRDANGILHRNALEHIPLKVEFETRENLTNEDMEAFYGSIRSNFTDATQRMLSVTAFVPELNDYITQDCYMPDPQFKIKRIDYNTNTIYYESIRFAFIGY